MCILRPPIVFAVCLAAVSVVAGVFLLDETTWSFGVFALLVVMTIVGDVLEVEARYLTISGAFLAIGLGMVMLGPVPGAALGVISGTADAVRRRPGFVYTISNVATFAAFPLAGGALAHAFTISEKSLNFALVTVATFMVANIVNFACIAVTRKLTAGFPIWRATR